jgi:hypothetical protein
VGNNSAHQRGGGLVNFRMLTVTNSTISGNRARFEGGGIFNYSTVTLTNSTVSNNTAEGQDDVYPNGAASGIYNGGTVTLRNTILAGNVDPSGKAADCLGTLTSQGYNLIGDLRGCEFVPGPGDQRRAWAAGPGPHKES